MVHLVNIKQKPQNFQERQKRRDPFLVRCNGIVWQESVHSLKIERIYLLFDPDYFKHLGNKFYKTFSSFQYFYTLG